jgi:6-phosphogluconolactonase
MAAQAWLEHVSIPASQIHIIPAELGAEAAARAYAMTLHKIDLFDLVILGLGEDGHTASLFPGHDWGEKSDSPATLAIHNAPKPPPARVSLSAHRLNQTRKLMFVVTGAAKRQAVNDWRNGKKIPATTITPEGGVDIYLEDNLL